MHLALGTNLFESFQRYQTRLIEEYRSLASEFGFVTVNARQPIEELQSAIRSNIMHYLRSGEAGRNGLGPRNNSADSTDED